MAILITGLGYIGSALARKLLQQGEQVVGLENFFSTPRGVVEILAREGNFTLIEGDITDAAVLTQAVSAADTVFHCAAQASADPAAASNEYTVATNFVGTQRLLDACTASHVARVVLLSSTRLYAPPLPQTLTETAPIHAPDIVHLSHLFGETLLRTGPWADRGIAARTGTVHGLGPVMKQEPRFLAVANRFCRQAARGEPLRVDAGPASLLAFIQLDDVVDGLITCSHMLAPELGIASPDPSAELGIASPDPSAAVVNLATEIRSVGEVASLVQRLGKERGIKVTILPQGGPPKTTPYTVTSLLDTSGFRPTRTLEDSLGAVLDHYLAVAG